MFVPAFFRRLQSLNRSVARALSDAEVRLPSGVVVEGIFNEPSAIADVGSLGMGTTAPVLWLLDEVLPTQIRGHLVHVRGADYEVLDVLPDGSGWTELTLGVKHV